VPFAMVQKKGLFDLEQLTGIIKNRPEIDFTKDLILKEKGLAPDLAIAFELSGPQKSLTRKRIYYLRIKKMDLEKFKGPVNAENAEKDQLFWYMARPVFLNSSLAQRYKLEGADYKIISSLLDHICYLGVPQADPAK
jgi:hypothetical protein